MRSGICFFSLLVFAAPIRAQGVYVPLDDPWLPMFDHLVARGSISDPSPGVRPLRRADAIAALRESSTTGDSLLRIEVLRHWSDSPDSAHWSLRAEAGFSGASTGRRDVLQPAGTRFGGAMVQAGGWLTTPHFFAGTRMMLDPRLLHDPDWIGSPEQRSANLQARIVEGYAGASWGRLMVHYGQIDREWGIPGTPGLAFANQESYARPDLAIAFHSRHLDAMVVLRALDGVADSTGMIRSRAFLAHRLDWNPARRLHLAAWETAVIGGPDDAWTRAAISSAYPLLPAALSSQPRTDRNIILGADVALRQRAWALDAQAAIQRAPPGDTSSSHWSGAGVDLDLHGPLANSAAWHLGYERLSGAIYTAPLQRGAPLLDFNDLDHGMIRTTNGRQRAWAQIAVPVRWHWLVQPGVALERGSGDDATQPNTITALTMRVSGGSSLVHLDLVGWVGSRNTSDRSRLDGEVRAMISINWRRAGPL